MNYGNKIACLSRIMRNIRSCVRKVFYWCEVNGGYVTAFCLLLPNILISITSSVWNQYQGGCPYPYISEVGREGFNRIVFIFSTLFALLPWIIYSMYYMDTNIKYSKYVIHNKAQRRIFALLHAFMCMLQCSSAVSFVIASSYDLIHYPVIHEKYTTWLCIECNIAYAIDSVLSYLYLKSTWSKMKWKKIILVSIAWFSVILFGTLNFIPGCSVQILPMNECFMWTSEDYCFANQNLSDPTMTLLRYYPHCKALHFIRGMCEYIALLCGMMHFSFLRGDIVIMRYEMCKWEITKEEKEHIKDRKDDANENVKERNMKIANRIVSTSNIYLIYYLRCYWEDYDSLHSEDGEEKLDCHVNLKSTR